MSAYRYEQLPKNLRDGAQRYLEHGILPGSFLTAVIRNDLQQACLLADEENFKNLPHIVRWFVNEVPASAWGSRARMQAWTARARAA